MNKSIIKLMFIEAHLCACAGYTSQIRKKCENVKIKRKSLPCADCIYFIKKIENDFAFETEYVRRTFIMQCLKYEIGVQQAVLCFV